MSIRGNSSLNIKFTQIDSKFSSSVICLYLGMDVDSEICLFICFVTILYCSINFYSFSKWQMPCPREWLISESKGDCLPMSDQMRQFAVKRSRDGAPSVCRFKDKRRWLVQICNFLKPDPKCQRCIKSRLSLSACAPERLSAPGLKA